MAKASSIQYEVAYPLDGDTSESESESENDGKESLVQGRQGAEAELDGADLPQEESKAAAIEASTTI